MAELYNLAAECRDMCTQLTWEFQHLTGQGAMYQLTVQASAQETVNVGCIACAAAFTRVSTTQSALKVDAALKKLCADANQSWNAHRAQTQAEPRKTSISMKEETAKKETLHLHMSRVLC